MISDVSLKVAEDSTLLVEQSAPSAMPAPLDRYLAATVLRDGSFRTKLFELVQKERQALAPELGLDLQRLFHLSALVEAREHWYQALFTGLILLGLAGWLWFGPTPLGSLILPLTLLATGITYFYKTYDERYHLVPLVKDKQGYDPAQLTQRLEKRYRARPSPRPLPGPDQNLVVYKGFIPFVGAGFDLNGWSFPVNISRPREEAGQRAWIKPFTLTELYAAVDKAIRQCRFESCNSCDFLFVSGKQIRGLDWILPDPAASPVLRVDEEYAHQYLALNDPMVRHYKWLRIFDWHNELILSYFLRFSIRGDHLFVEVNRFLLPPLQAAYRKIDQMGEPYDFMEQVSHLAGLLIGCLAAGPFVAVWKMLLLVGRCLKGLSKLDLFGWRRRRRAARLRRETTFDYGTELSLRMQLSSTGYHHYFQMLDQEMYTKVFEKQILEALIDFLAAHNIDTSDIRERQNAILNTGLIMQGGELKTEALAVGSGAQSVVRQPELSKSS
jgi:hypothetical protein